MANGLVLELAESLEMEDCECIAYLHAPITSKLGMLSSLEAHGHMSSSNVDGLKETLWGIGRQDLLPISIIDRYEKFKKAENKKVMHFYEVNSKS